MVTVEHLMVMVVTYGRGRVLWWWLRRKSWRWSHGGGSKVGRYRELTVEELMA